MSVTAMGYDEAIATLRGIDVAMRSRLVRTAAKAVVDSAAQEMRAAAPMRRDRSRTGGRVNQRLRSQLAGRVVAYRDGMTTWAGAGERGYRAGQRHAHLIEFGHRIVSRGTVSQVRWRVKKTTGEAVARSYTPRSRRSADRTGKGRVHGMTTPRPFMGPIVTKYMGEAPERLRAALTEAIAAHVAGGNRG